MQCGQAPESANIRPVAWFELNRVKDADGEHPQYLVAERAAPKGSPVTSRPCACLPGIRKSRRYETAYIENDLCGALPVRVGKGAKGEPEFRFHEMDGAKEERVYHLIQTVVRREREEGAPRGSARSRAGKAAASLAAGCRRVCHGEFPGTLCSARFARCAKFSLSVVSSSAERPMTLHITESEVRQFFTMEMAIDAVESVSRKQAEAR